jgi:hypothetical protein
LTGFTHALIAGIEQQVWRLVQWAVAPGLKPDIELFRAAADLG